MHKYLVAISLDKVQTFLYYCISGKTQQQQLEENTLKDVIEASDEISNVFSEIVKSLFNLKEKPILSISGKIIFTVQVSSESEVKKRLKKLYEMYYYAHEGKVKITYWYTEEYDKDIVKIIKECNKVLKSQQVINKVIWDNQKILFRLASPEKCIEVIKEYEEQKKYIEENIKVDFIKSKFFVQGLDELVDERQKEESETGKIAFIKADINNMGKIMEGLEGERYMEISQLLNKSISLLNLKKKVEEKKLIICPFYAAGDDIFFATKIEGIFPSVNIINAMINEFNERLYDSDYKLSVSIGIEINDSDLPLRYYYDSVEEQLAKAKKGAKDEENRDKINASICINDVMFYINLKNGEKSNRDTWNNFKDQAYTLKHINTFKEDMKGGDEIASRTFFFNLIEGIENPEVKKDHNKYINVLLHHLMPSYLSYPLFSVEKCKIDLIVKNMLIRLLVKDGAICIDEERKELFQKKLRLFLLFTDRRYQSVNCNESDVKDFKEEAKERVEGYIKDEKYKLSNIRSNLMTKPSEYIYKKIINNNNNPQKELYKFFLNRREEQKVTTNECHTVHYYTKLKVGISTLYRIKNLYESDRKEDEKIEKISIILEHLCGEEDFKISDLGSSSSKETPRQYYQKFDKDFFDIAIKKRKFNSDFLETILIFYQLDNYKEIISLIINEEKSKANHRKGYKKNGKNNRNKSKNYNHK